MGFFGINVATQGLYTSKTALNIVNHNISNAETPGYSRQYGVQSATRPLSTGKIGMIGTGSEITEVKQYRSDYLDQKYWSMVDELGEYSIKDELMGQVETLFNEPSDSGFGTYFSDMYDSLQTLITNPAEDSIKENFIDSAQNFTSYFKILSENLQKYQRDANFGVKICVNEINSIAEQIATINYQIRTSEVSGNNANDLRDKRVNLIDELSELINVDVKVLTDEFGVETMKISIGGQTLVEGDSYNVLELEPRTYLKNPEDQPSLYDIKISGRYLNLSGEHFTGKLKGYIDVRDGNNGENFKGNIYSESGTTVVVDGWNRNDIPATGSIYINNELIEYTGYTYDDTTKMITFNLATAVTPSVVGTTAEIGNSVDYKGIPYYINQLNEFVRTVALKFNEIHKTGNGGTAEEFFAYDGYSGTGLDESNKFTYNQITIDNFEVSEKIISDINLLATSADATAGESANDLLIKLANLRHDPDMFSKGEPENYMQALISEVGIDVKQADSFYTGQNNLCIMVKNQRLSISSVDITEETTDMLRFQQAYNLSAKMISVMDEIYDVTINQLKR